MDLASHPFIAHSRLDRLGPLADSATVLHFADEAIIFDEGALPDALYLVLSGEVAFHKRLPDASLLQVSTSGPGEYFGEVGIFTHELRSLRAVASGEVDLARVPKDALLEYVRDLPGPLEYLLQGIIRHLHTTTGHYVEEMIHKERMAIVGNMMHTIIHDFKNPFCLISLSAQLLRQKTAGDPNLQRLCNNIEEQVNRMVHMTNELAEYARGNAEMRKQRLHLRELLAEFQELHSPLFHHPQVRVRVNVPAVHLEGEKHKLFRVFENLITNAIEAMEDGIGLVELGGQVDHAEQQVEITVRDNGNGIPPEIRDRFFEPFISMGKRHGTGLGSAIVKSIVDAHNGQIRFETATGEGTIIYMRFPLAS